MFSVNKLHLAMRELGNLSVEPFHCVSVITRVTFISAQEVCLSDAICLCHSQPHLIFINTLKDKKTVSNNNPQC